MKLDRNDPDSAGNGKYALLLVRKLDEYRSGTFGKLPSEIAHAIAVLEHHRLLDYGRVGTESEFFVMRLKDKYAADGLASYALAARDDDPEWCAEVAVRIAAALTAAEERGRQGVEAELTVAKHCIAELEKLIDEIKTEDTETAQAGKMAAPVIGTLKEWRDLMSSARPLAGRAEMSWRERAKKARLSHTFIARAAGYSNRAKVSQAFGWESGVRMVIRMVIVTAEWLTPAQLDQWIAACHEDDLPAGPKEE